MKLCSRAAEPCSLCKHEQVQCTSVCLVFEEETGQTQAHEWYRKPEILKHQNFISGIDTNLFIKKIFVEDMEDLIYWLSYSASQIVLFISIAFLLNRNPRLLQQAQAMEFFMLFFSHLYKFLRNPQTKHF